MREHIKYVPFLMLRLFRIGYIFIGIIFCIRNGRNFQIFVEQYLRSGGYNQHDTKV